MTRRDFLHTAAIAGAGANILGAMRYCEIPFMSVGICGPVQHAADYAAYGYAFVEPTVQRFLVLDRPEEAFKINLDAAKGAACRSR